MKNPLCSCLRSQTRTVCNSDTKHQNRRWVNALTKRKTKVPQRELLPCSFATVPVFSYHRDELKLPLAACACCTALQRLPNRTKNRDQDDRKNDCRAKTQGARASTTRPVPVWLYGSEGTGVQFESIRFTRGLYELPLLGSLSELARKGERFLVGAPTTLRLRFVVFRCSNGTTDLISFVLDRCHFNLDPERRLKTKRRAGIFGCNCSLRPNDHVIT